MKHLSKYLLAVLILSISFFGLSPSTMASEQKTYNIWHWNIAGWAIHEGATGALIDGLGGSVVARDANFVSLNEVCWNQYVAVIEELRDRAWPEHSSFARFSTIREQPDICNGQPYGVAMFSKEGFGTAERLRLTTTTEYHEPGDGNTLLCAPQANQPEVRFCTTHIITGSYTDEDGNNLNEIQLEEVRQKLESYYENGDRVIIAGDFNVQPHYGRLNGWYSSSLDTQYNSNNTGQYRELDDLDSGCLGYGERTTRTETIFTNNPCNQGGKKIDMIFVREDYIVGNYSADALGGSTECVTAGSLCSDHRSIIGTVTIAVN